MQLQSVGAVIEESSSSGEGKIAFRPIERNHARGILLCFCFAVVSPVSESIGSWCFGSVRRGRGVSPWRSIAAIVRVDSVPARAFVYVFRLDRRLFTPPTAT